MNIKQLSKKLDGIPLEDNKRVITECMNAIEAGLYVSADMDTKGAANYAFGYLSGRLRYLGMMEG